jgi:TonB family protein
MSKKLLLIEYEPRYLDRIRGFLEGKDFELVVARDGEEGLEAFRRSKPDAVLVSSVLPKLRTPDVIKGIHDLGDPPPILLMMAGYRGKNRVADAKRVGATSILEKPFTEEVFLAELEAACRGGAPGFGAVAGPPLLSSDDIFSDVLSGMEEPQKPATAPGAKPMSDADRKLHDTLSGLMAVPKKEIPLPADGRTMRLETPAPFPAPPVRSEKPVRRDSDVDRMLTQTLSGMKGGKAPEKVPEKSDKPPAPRPAASQLADLERGLLDRGSRPSAAPSSKPGTSPGVVSAPSAAQPLARPQTPAPPLAAPVPAPASPPATAPKGTAGGTGGNFGRYHLLEKIAAGGMAEVFKARMSGEEGFEKIVAIKRILPHMADSVDFITMFIDEAKLAAQLTHSNIIHIYDLGKVDAYHYIAMEYVEGKDLRSILKLGQERGWPLPLELALFVASKIANALDYAHRRLGPDGRELDLVHRDVSPQNILISFEGDIKLCDFGIAKAATKMSQTQTGALKGKLQYMSPEQAWGKKVDRRTDVYSLGLVLHEMLTGDRLFTGDTDLAILEQVRDATIAPPSSKNPDVPEKVDQIVLKALSKDPAARFQNASELEKEINAVLYSFQPTPGPADLAIYMHRLLEAAPVPSDEQIDAAFAMAAAGPGTGADTKAKKGKGLVISKKAPAEPAPMPVPPPEHPAPEPVAVQAVGAPKSKAGLFAGLGIAAVAVIAGGIYLTKGGGAKPAAGTGPVAPVTASAPATVGGPEAAVTVSQAPERIVDPKAVAEEAKRLGAIQAEELRKAGAAKGAAVPTPAKGVVAAASPDLSMNPNRPIQPPVPAQAAAAAPAPTQRPPEPVRPAPEPPKVAEAARPAAIEAAPAAPAPPPAIPAPSNAPVREGDLVGPGDGVVEPRLVRLGPFPPLPPQSKVMARRGSDGSLGSPTVHVLVGETGSVLETRVVRPSAYKFVDEAAVAALKGAKIDPATKDGIRVKMWKAFTIGVKP